MVPAFYLKYAIFGSKKCSLVKSDFAILTASKKRSWSQNLKSLAQKKGNELEVTQWEETPILTVF